MIETLLQHLAPHYCCGCLKIGSLLCDVCKYDIISETFNICIGCGKPVLNNHGVCGLCRLPYQRAWCVGPRYDSLQHLINQFKFSNAKAAHKPLASLLHDRLPVLPKNTIIVPVPTIASHIRQRGFDHTSLIARRLAALRGLTVATPLTRATKTVQHSANRQQRITQAKVAFECSKAVSDEPIYLLIDDVATTGSTLRYAAKTLRQHGAKTVWVAVLSYQALD